ncbi:MAG TPA: hypothetical protein VKT72_07185 [Candidatus Baltobacteraceae bacterium]|nr:hypothetical protein [Candidatus Baltobacteraceae bacterium]
MMKHLAYALTAPACFLLCTTAFARAGSGTCTITVPQSGSDPAGAANQFSLGYDFTYKRKADQSTTVSITQDAAALILDVVAKQREPVTAIQTTNGPGVLNDDNVTVYIWPHGTTGFAYTFAANPRAARDQTSSENAAYAPEWGARATRTSGGYTIVMRIPFDVMRTDGSTAWKIQVSRTIVATNSTYVWCDDSAQVLPFDATFAGTFEGVDVKSVAHAVRPKPRLALYGLGETQPGSDTSRIGADLSLPFTPTASFVATLHPDYSNVEMDQQTIAPTAFPRQYQEVRPFFTQLNSYVNPNMFCSLDCPQELYTPGIPAFSQGYAVEGTQGHLAFGAFDAVGVGRSDGFASANYTYEDSDKAFQLAVQRVSVDAGASAISGPIHDDVTYASTGYMNQHSHLFAYANAAVDSGSAVSDASQATYAEEGAGYILPSTNTVVMFSLQHIGPQFVPQDGYVQQPDVTGYDALAQRVWTFKPNSELQDVSATEVLYHQHNSFAQPDLVQSTTQLNLDFKRQYTLHLFDTNLATQTTYATPSSGDLAPFDSSGAMIGYRYGTSTPTSISYSAGPFYHGRSGEWSFVTTVGLAPRIHLGLEADRTWYAPSAFAAAKWGESGAPEWLEKATLDWQFSHIASLDFGVRRVVGMVMPNAFQQPIFGVGTSCANAAAGAIIDCSNLSAGFHLLVGHQELYMAYGDPSLLETKPAFIVKWIQYLGAEKGT